MKKQVLFFFLLIINLQVWSGEPAKVFIVAGQSNTDGRVPNMLLPDYIKELTSDTSFVKGAYKHCKIAQNRSDGRFLQFWPKSKRRSKPDAWAYDAVTYYLLEQKLQEDFYVVKWAIGGTSIEPPTQSANGVCWSANPEWLSKNYATSEKKGDEKERGKSLLLSFTDSFDKCVDQTLSKIKDGYQIEAFLWHQGESDSKAGEKYYDNLKTMLSYVRTHLSEKTGQDYSELPFILGSIPHHNKQYSAEVESAMIQLAKEDANVFLVDMSTQELQGDQLHFNQKSAEYLGQQMYKLLEAIIK